MRTVLAFTLIVCFNPVFGQTRRRAPKPPPAPAVTSWPLVAIKVTGNELYTEQAIVTASGLKIGQTVLKEDFDKARDRLVATCAFETVGFEFGPAASGKGYEGKFEIAEIKQVYPYRFEDLPAADAEIRAFLKQREPIFGDKIPGTSELLARFTKDVSEFVATKNFKDKVIGRVTADRPNELAVLFRPGTQSPSIANVSFTGNQAVSNSILHNVMGEVAIGVPYSEVRVRELLETSIRPLYEARGRMRVSFPKIETKPATGVIGVNLSVQVEEGAVYNFGKIVVMSSKISPQELYGVAKLKSGEVANFDSVANAQIAMQHRFHRAGYMEMSSAVERKTDDAAKTVDVTIKTNAGPQFKMGALKVQGLDVESEPSVRKLWSMKEGAPFDDTYPQTFLTRIQEDGYFDNLKGTRFDNEVNRKNDTVDVTLYFTGGAPKPEKPRTEPRP
jgi:outer membrane protein insertion porin family